MNAVNAAQGDAIRVLALSDKAFTPWTLLPFPLSLFPCPGLFVVGHFQTITRRKLSGVPEVLRTKAPLAGSPKRAEREALAAALLLYENDNYPIVSNLSRAERQVYRHMCKMFTAKNDKITGYFSNNCYGIPDSHKNEGIIMTQKTLSDHLRDQAQNARNWLNQKVPGTKDCTRKELMRDILIALIKPVPENPYDNTLNGYQGSGPQGPGMYVDGVRIDCNTKHSSH